MARQKKNSIQAKAQKKADARRRKTQKLVREISIVSVSILLIVAVVIGVGAACGLFDYYPEVTHHVNVEIEGYGTLHIELYGKDAPKTVETFVKNVQEHYFDNHTFHTFLNGLLYGGNEGAEGLTYEGREYYVKGEFAANGHQNRIKHERGVLSMSRGEGYDSGFGQFFIVTKDRAKELDGNYAAFGRVIDGGMDIIDKIIADLTPGANGMFDKDERPVIKSITVHASH